MIKISIWSDFACPYCYIGEMRLLNAINDLGINDKVTVDYRAFELDPKMDPAKVTGVSERFAGKYNMSPEKAAAQIEEISQLGRDMGIDFKYATALYTNTLSAHRLMKYAEAKYDADTVSRLNERLFKAYFVDNAVLNDINVLASAAADVGMNSDEVKIMLTGTDYTDAVRADERRAEDLRVAGVPFFLIDEKFAIRGAISTEDFKDALKQMIAHKHQPEHYHDEKPHSCGHNGCDLV